MAEKYFVNYIASVGTMRNGDTGKEEQIPHGSFINSEDHVIFSKKGKYFECIGVASDDTMKLLRKDRCQSATRVMFGKFVPNINDDIEFIMNKDAQVIYWLKQGYYGRINQALTENGNASKKFAFAICECWCKIILKEQSNECLAADFLDGGTSPYSLYMVRTAVEDFVKKYYIRNISPIGSGRLHARDSGGRIAYAWRKCLTEELSSRKLFPTYLTTVEEITPYLLGFLDNTYNPVMDTIESLPDPETI